MLRKECIRKNGGYNMIEKEKINPYVEMSHKIEIKKSEDGGFFVSIPDLPGCFSQADTMVEAYEIILDAKKAWIEVALETGETIPEPSDEKKHSGKMLLRIPPELHSELALNADLQGVSLNQYLTYLLTKTNEKQSIKVEPHFHKYNIDKVEVKIESPKSETYGNEPINRIKGM